MEKYEIVMRDCGDYFKAELRTYTRLDPIVVSGVGLGPEEASSQAVDALRMVDQHIQVLRESLENQTKE